MPNWGDNGNFLLLGMAAFWAPVIGYWLWMKVCVPAVHNEEEDSLAEKS